MLGTCALRHVTARHHGPDHAVWDALLLLTDHAIDSNLGVFFERYPNDATRELIKPFVNSRSSPITISPTTPPQDATIYMGLIWQLVSKHDGNRETKELRTLKCREINEKTNALRSWTR